MHHKAKGNGWRIFKWIVFGFIGLGVAATILFMALVLPGLPSVDSVENLVAAQSSLILDRDGEVLYTIHGDENRKTVSFDNISSNIVNAALAIEDDQFYEHIGIDILSIMRALCDEIGICGTSRGGSTITQQFVKNAFLSSERTYTRKAKEIILSLQLESKFSKDKILEMYLNRIPYGSNVFGVEMASKTFFDKTAAELTIAEGAILAAIPKAPTYYSPYGNHKYAIINLDAEEIINMDIRSEKDLVSINPEFISKGLLGKTYHFGTQPKEETEETEEVADNDTETEEMPEFEEEFSGPDARSIYVKGRVDFVLGRLLELGKITQEEYDEALIEANNKEFIPYREEIKAPHFVLYVRELLEAKYGKDQIEKGGLRITTTLDYEMQQKAEEAIITHGESNETRFNASNAALLSMNPDTGEILAMVGSRDYWNEEIDGNVNVALRPRLPGSSFKPIAYAAAFLQGYAPSTVFYDVKTKFGTWYEPENFDSEFRGPVSIREALAHSINVPAVKATYVAGVPNVLDLARKLGIQLNQPDDWYGISLGLGAGEVQLIDLVGAYSTFANGGYKTEPISILKVEDKNGSILEKYEASGERELILDPQVAYLVNDVLSDVEARPEGFWRQKLSVPGHQNGAKTGTSNKRKDEDTLFPFDAWTLGYTRNLATGVWTGNSNGDHLYSKASGLSTAAPIWHDFMVAATADMKPQKFDTPEGIKWIKVSKRSGKLPSEYTPEEEIMTEVFASFSAPTDVDDYQLVEIDKASGKLATEYTPDSAREEKGFFVHHSFFPNKPDWEDPVREWAEENDEDEEIPTEYDDVHTPDNAHLKPEIKITSPTSLANVSAPRIGVVVDIESKGGIEEVQFYWDDELVESVTAPPYKGEIPISKSLKKGSKHVIKAIIIDELYNSNQSSIQVKIGDDEIPPKAKFIIPKNNTRVPVGSSVAMQVDAHDPNGDIARVDFKINGTKLYTDEKAPYIWQFAPSAAGDFEIVATATDHAGNATVAKLNIIAENTELEPLTGSSRITSPRKNETFDEGESILIKTYLDSESQEGLSEMIVYAKKKGSAQAQIARISGDEAGGLQAYTFIWDSPEAGTYDLSLKIVLQNGKTRFSKKVPIVVK